MCHPTACSIGESEVEAFKAARLASERMPPWIRVKIPVAGMLKKVESTLRELSLNTVCESALCPNRGSCFSRGTATFMILGPICTRNCPFCAVPKGRPEPVDGSEPARVAEAVKRLGLKHVVITSVNRDDLPDKGASQFAATVRAIRRVKPDATIELLIPDFCGSKEAIDLILEAKPTILNHNLETVRRLHPIIKPKSDYDRSLWLLKYVKNTTFKSMLTKSGLMVGLGETDEEVLETMREIRETGCDIITIGQYLKPPNSKLEVKRYVKPETFEKFKEAAEQMGFRFVASAPLVRSSFNAADILNYLGV